VGMQTAINDFGASAAYWVSQGVPFWVINQCLTLALNTGTSTGTIVTC